MKVPISVSMEYEMVEFLRAYAAERGKSVSEVVCTAVTDAGILDPSQVRVVQPVGEPLPASRVRSDTANLREPSDFADTVREAVGLAPVSAEEVSKATGVLLAVVRVELARMYDEGEITGRETSGGWRYWDKEADG